MPSPFGEGQTDTPINRRNLGEVPPPFTHSPVLISNICLWSVILDLPIFLNKTFIIVYLEPIFSYPINN